MEKDKISELCREYDRVKKLIKPYEETHILLIIPGKGLCLVPKDEIEYIGGVWE